MLRGIYSAASGMLVESMRTDVMSNNLANVDTAGFKRQAAHVRSFPETLISRMHSGERTPIGTLGTGAVVDGSHSSFSAGRLHPTGNSLDAALFGHGFFVIETPEGTRYTRDGRFILNETGFLSTLDGHRVLGENGPILIGDGDVQIDSRGVLTTDDQVVNRFLIVEFPDREGLVRQGANLFEATEEAGDPFRFNTTVLQGTLEESNVNVIREMVGMITLQRAYEANQKVIQAFDETLGKAVNEIAN